MSLESLIEADQFKLVLVMKKKLGSLIIVTRFSIKIYNYTCNVWSCIFVFDVCTISNTYLIVVLLALFKWTKFVRN